jgi:hypothetical protein
MLSRSIPAALMLVASTGVVLPGDLTGTPSIIDGDTLEIHGARIRLWGIDAPETDQFCRNGSEHYRCGQKAANDLDAFIGRRTVDASRSIAIGTNAPWRSAPSPELIWQSGWCAAGWRSIGPNTPSALTRRRSQTRSAQTSEYGAVGS